MSQESPTGKTRDPGHDDQRRTEDHTGTESRPERNADEQNENKGQGPFKGTDTAATTNAEDMDKARRTTM
jgi:hypothetical protein